MDLRGTSLARAALALLLGFALLELPLVQALFDGVAVALATAAGAALALAGHEINRTGTLLRDVQAGWGMDVTRVCDGHGLLIALGALVLALAPARRRAGVVALGGAGAIQIFNLLRLLVLAVVLDRAPAQFETVHLEVFPLLTAGLLLGTVAALRPEAVRAVGWALGLLALLGGAWLAGADRLAALILVPGANLTGWLAGSGPVGAIATRPDGWVVETLLLAGREPLMLHRAPIHPADFAISWPALAAAGLVAGRSVWPWLLLAAVLSVMALALGARTETWLLASSAGVTEQVVQVAEGQFRAAPYDLPSPMVQEAARLLQNVIVHLNLLVLPGLILARGAALRGRPA